MNIDRTGDARAARVLLGVDFGPASLAAARWATSFITPRADVRLVHVLPEEPTRARAQELDGGLRGFAETLETASSSSLLRAGSASHWLSALASEVEGALLVLGRRAHSARTRVGEPNVIERAARRTRAPVLVVPEGTTEAPGHVLAAVDGSAFAPVVVQAARQLARLRGIPMTVLHVLSPVAGAYERVIRSARRVIEETTLPSAARALPDLTSRWLTTLARTRGTGEDVRVEVASGDPVREIAMLAATHAAPLVIVGMRGADFAPNGSLGSIARELLTRAPMPVLAVQV